MVRDAEMGYGSQWNVRARKTVWVMNIVMMDCAETDTTDVKLIQSALVGFTVRQRRKRLYVRSKYVVVMKIVR
jgi:hypothetical protein